MTVSDELERMLDNAGAHAENLLIDQHEDELLPFFHMITADGENILAPTPWRDEDDKRDMLGSIRLFMRMKNVVRYSVVSEAWAASQPKDWKPGQDISPMPSERPDRREIVIAIAADKERTVSRSWDIVRGEAGSIVKLQLDKDFAGSQEGRMGSLLK
jgi:hypothetical protein